MSLNQTSTKTDRSLAIRAWLKPWLTNPDAELSIVAGDASFRSYYRVAAEQNTRGKSMILMDAPPEKESSHSFISLAKAWRQQGIKVPQVLAYDLQLGTALLEDFGDLQFMQQVTQLPTSEVDTLYHQALNQLTAIQQLAKTATNDHPLPDYSKELLTQELNLFDDWFYQGLLELPKTSLPKNWAAFKQSLIVSALEQPQVTVHRDYHSRNLMVLGLNQLGIIDFQDAVYGPCTYDAVSLIRDCYLDWPEQTQQAWLAYFHRAYCQQATPVSLAEFKRWFDWMGIHRHLKVAGIFSRLALRDAKPNYLQDIPLTLQHLLRATQNYADFADIQTWLSELVIPSFNAYLQQGNNLQQPNHD
ncbi:aminoglycoside phosphotransferase family protein [Marinospirillum insulare]|nr:phosphotransferase [Marinospirillum insulare]